MVSGLTLKYKVRRPVIQEGHGLELLLIYIKKNQLRLLEYLIRIPSGQLAGEVSCICTT